MLMINDRRRDYHIIVCHREYQGRLINGGIINRHNIGESVLIKCSERLTVYRDAVNDGRILCINYRMDGIYLIAFPVSVGFDRQDCRVIHATGLYKDSLFVIGLFVFQSHLTASVRQMNIKIANRTVGGEIQHLVCLLHAQRPQYIDSCRERLLEVQIIGTRSAILGRHNELGGIAYGA